MLKENSTLTKKDRILLRKLLIGIKIGSFTVFFQGAFRGKVFYLQKVLLRKIIMIWVSF